MRQQQSHIITAMATTTTTTKHLLQHPNHEHPLELLNFSNAPIAKPCRLCNRKISATEAYTCQEGCKTYDYHIDDLELNYYHKVCVEAPPQIDRHPLHPDHPLPLIHHGRAFCCDACSEDFDSGGSSFRCHECDFDLDICCALSTPSDEGGSLGGKTSEPITLPLHPHTLTSFSSRHGFFGDRDCYICRGSVEGDGYICLRRSCEFIIHKGCIQDLYYSDGTKAPRIYHRHPLEIFVGEDTGSTRCASCESDKSGEFIGCSTCQVFHHRNCLQFPESLHYPSHNPDHTLVLFPDIDDLQQCQSCSRVLEDEIYYRCTSCEFFVHVGCVLQVLTYCEEGMSAKIKLSWHEHRLLLCHRNEFTWNRCSYCRDQLNGPTYLCGEVGCSLQLHKRCIEIKSTITHPHHPDHPLTLCRRDDDNRCPFCNACGRAISGLMFSCERCLVDLHVKCATRFPTHKHYLHEHKLVRLGKHRSLECNRCSTRKKSPVFRCVPCNFNLHEECMELPKVMRNDKIHWHPLTLHETFVEDDSGKYYCEHCEKTRDPLLGVYVCEYCKISLPRIYHIHCVLPELGKVYAKKEHQPSAVEKLRVRIADQTEEVRSIEEKLKEAKEKLDELKNQHNKLLDEDSKNESSDHSESESSDDSESESCEDSENESRI